VSQLKDWMLKPGYVHLTHGSFGAMTKSLFQQLMEETVVVEETPDAQLIGPAKKRVLENMKNVATFVGAHHENMAFVSGAMAGMNAALRSLIWNPGDEILCTNHGYKLVDTVLGYLERRCGVVVKRVNLPAALPSIQIILQAFDRLMSPRTKWLVLDHISSPTAC
jgi:isopenicillin-N epimerase